MRFADPPATGFATEVIGASAMPADAGRELFNVARDVPEFTSRLDRMNELLLNEPVHHRADIPFQFLLSARIQQ